MLTVNERIEVMTAPNNVWAILSNPHEVVHCVEGAELGQQLDDGSFDATMTVKFGPAKVAFNANVLLTLEPASLSGEVSGRGKDTKGGTKFRTTMRFKVENGANPDQSAIAITAEVEISGRLASMIETGASLVIKRMTASFTQALAKRCITGQIT